MRTRTLTAAAAVLAATALTGCGSTTPTTTATPQAGPATPSPDPTQQLQTWMNTTGSAAIGTVSTDLDTVGKNMDVTKLHSMADACGKLTADIETVQSGDAAPDRQTATEWKLALQHLGAAAAHCTTGATAADGSEIEKATAELTIGINHLKALTDRLDAAGITR